MILLRLFYEFFKTGLFSVGGGMVEMQRFEGFPVSIDGGYHEYLLLIDAHAAPLEQAAASVKAVASSDELRAESDGAMAFCIMAETAGLHTSSPSGFTSRASGCGRCPA